MTASTIVETNPWAPVLPLIVVDAVTAAYQAAELELDRPLQAGDGSPCCPGERLADWPYVGGDVCCPRCGICAPALEAVTA